MIRRIIQFFQPHEWALIVFLVVMLVLLTGCATQKTAYTPFIIEMYRCGEPYALVIQDSQGSLVVSKPHNVLGDDKARTWLYSVIESMEDKTRNIAKNDVENCKGI